MDSGDLMRRVRISVKDTDGVKHLISNDIENVGKKAAFKKHLKNRRDRLEDRLEARIVPINNEIDFYNEQISDIEAL
jgi:hypothetical protein